MIVRVAGKRLVVVRQPDHGLQTGTMASQWGNEDVGAFSPRHRVIEAAARHDNGWSLWEGRPTLDEQTSRPLQFFKLPRHDHVAAYRAGIAEAARSDPWVGLLVSMHGVGFYNERYGTWKMRDADYTPEEQALVDEFVKEQEALQAQLCAAALRREAPTPITTDPDVWRNYLLLQVWDRLSLQFAWRGADDGVIDPLPLPGDGFGELRCSNAGQLTLELDPYPFVESPCVLPVVATIVRDRDYKHPEDFLEELLGTAPTVLECKALRREGKAPG